MSGTNIKTIDRVHTWLTCRGSCWQVGGSNNVYRNPDWPNQFSVYLRTESGRSLDTDWAATSEFVLYYDVEGPCS